MLDRDSSYIRSFHDIERCWVSKPSQALESGQLHVRPKTTCHQQRILTKKLAVFASVFDGREVKLQRIVNMFNCNGAYSHS